MSEYVGANVSLARGSVPGMWRPSVMYGSSAPEIPDWETIPGGWGLVRGSAPFAGNNFTLASSDANFITRATAYFNLAHVQTAIERGTAVVTVIGPPTYLSSATPMYTVFAPSDLTAGGTWQLNCKLLCDTAQSVLGSLYRAPRNAQGAIEIGQPGLIFECGNEWGGGSAGALANAKLTYQRFRAGIKASDPDAAVTLPGPVNYATAEGTGNTFLEEMIAFAGANAAPPDLVNWHNFQGLSYPLLPEEDVSGAESDVTAALASAGLSASTTRILTEFQSNLPGADGIGTRSDYRSAAYFASTIWEHARAGVSGMCFAQLRKQGTAPPDSNPFAESGTFGGWGMITKGTVQVPCGQFSLAKLFSLWDGAVWMPDAVKITADTNIRSVAAVNGNDVTVLATRWDPGGDVVALEIEAGHPGKTLSEVRVYRFDATNNNVPQVFATTVGTDLQKAAAARAVGLDPIYTSGTNPLQLQFADIDTAMVRFMFTDSPRERRRSHQRSEETRSDRYPKGIMR